LVIFNLPRSVFKLSQSFALSVDLRKLGGKLLLEHLFLTLFVFQLGFELREQMLLLIESLLDLLWLGSGVQRLLELLLPL
jgi:hypothetical protein